MKKLTKIRLNRKKIEFLPILMPPFFMISPIKLTVALSSASMASAVEVLLMSVPESRTSLDMDGALDFDHHTT